MTRKQWVQRRFWDFRQGHGVYLSYVLSLFNFLIVTYYLLISNVPFLACIFPNVWIFGIIFSMIYLPLAIIVGWIVFRKHQFKTDIEISAMENPFRFRSIVPSRETILDLPLLKLSMEMQMKFYEKEGLLTDDMKMQYEGCLRLIDKLVKGESIEK